MPPRAGLRFRPPPTELPKELIWLLQVAFGPGWQAPPPGCDPTAAIGLAAAFDLGPRIVGRHPADRLRDCLGPETVALVRAHRQAVAVALANERLAGRIAALAAGAETPVVFLKGYALTRLVPGPPGLRPYGDLDLLVPSERAAGLQTTLCGSGFRSLPVPANEQHLAPLESPAGTGVDLHFRLRGVSLGHGWATADELLAAGLCRPLPELPGSASIPSPRLMTAHLVVHGIEQHGHRPSGYPLLRMVADLADLVPEPERWSERLGPARDWIRATVSAEEVAAAFRLAELLAAGRLPEAGRDPDARALLEHVAAGTLDPAYRESLRLDHTAGRLAHAVEEGHLLRYISRKLRRRAPSEQASRHRPGLGGTLFRNLMLGTGLARSALLRALRRLPRTR